MSRSRSTLSSASGRVEDHNSVLLDPFLVDDGAVAPLAADGQPVPPGVLAVAQAQVEDQPAALVVTGEQAAHLADPAAPFDRRGQLTARTGDVAEKSEQVEQVGLARCVRPDDEQSIVGRSLESLEVPPVVRGHVRDAHVTPFVLADPRRHGRQRIVVPYSALWRRPIRARAPERSNRRFAGCCA